MKKIMLLLLLILFSNNILSADILDKKFEKAENLFNEQKYEESFKMFLELAKKGHIISIDYLGYSYEYGYGVKVNINKAYEWYKTAADKGSTYSMRRIGILYYTGENFTKDYTKAFEWFNKSNTDYISQYYLGLLYFDGSGAKKNLDKSFAWFLKSAQAGYVTAQEYMGYMYEYGYGTEINYEAALEWYEKAIINNSVYALNRTGIIYFNGNKNIEKDQKKAFKYFSRAAENNNLNSIEYMGYMYEFGYGVEKNYQKAIEWYKKGIEKQSNYSYHAMGIIYFDGKGVDKDRKKAFDFFLDAANLGYSESMEYLGYMYENGYGVEIDYKKAMDWYLKADDLNSAYAQNRIGALYYEGKGVRQNNEKAYEWFKKSANNGNTNSAEMITEMLDNGFKPTKYSKAKDKEGPVIYIDHELVPNKVITARVKISGRSIDESGVALVYINNKEANIDKDGNFEASILLKMGDNNIPIEAIDIYENTTQQTFSITRLAENETIKPERTIHLYNWYLNQYAIVVGINNYQNSDIPDLSNAENDANAITRILKKSGYHVTSLTGKDATRKNILKTIKSLKSKITNHDSFLFYFAGHGQAIETAHGKMIGYLIPFDAEVSLYAGDIIDYEEETISLDQLKKYINDIPAKHVALLLDSCFSGLAMESRGIRPVTSRSSDNSEYYEALLENQSINILTAGDDQPVSDGTEHSPFTRALIMALEKGSIDITDGDGYATFSELAVYIKKKVEKITDRKQKPQYDNLSDEDGDFIFKIGY